MTEPFALRTELIETEKAVSIAVRALYLLAFGACWTSAREQLADWRDALGTERGSSVTTRVLFFLNCNFMIFSIAMILGRTLQPVNDDNSLHVTWGAFGTQATCNVQGFVSHALAMAFYMQDATLSLSYLLMIQYKWTETSLRKLQKPLLFLIVLVPSILSSFGLYAHTFNPEDDGCTFPVLRESCSDVRDGICFETQVVRGGDASVAHGDLIYSLHSQGISLLVLSHILFTVYTMITISCFARRQATETSTRLVFKALFIASVALTTELPMIFYFVLHQRDPNATDVGFLGICARLSYPLMGVENMLIFFWGRKEMKTRMGSWIQNVLQIIAFPFHSQQETMRYTLGPDLFASSNVDSPRRLKTTSPVGDIVHIGCHFMMPIMKSLGSLSALEMHIEPEALELRDESPVSDAERNLTAPQPDEAK